MIHVVVCIPTFRRPTGLRRLLISLAAQDFSGKLEIIVADNDPENAEGVSVVSEMQQLFGKHSLTAIIVQERGISFVRNTLVAAALKNTTADYVTMIDDDQSVSRTWISRMLACSALYRTDVVKSNVVYMCTDPSRRAEDCPLFAKRVKSREGRVPLIYATNGVLFTRSSLCNLGEAPFDAEFALTGGSDAELFDRMARQGATFAFCADAIATEWVPVSRLEPSWFLRRQLRIGESDMKILMKRRALWLVAQECTKAGAALLIGGILQFVPPKHQQLKWRGRLFRAVGKLRALGGYSYQEYLVTHGS